jgi:lipid-A-disaccharide synthase-like uncharacterized protein
MQPELVWPVIGFLGQGLFFSRLLVQWIASERRRASVVPPVFWLLSLSGGLVLLSYGIHRRDPVLVSGQLGGLLVYARNLWLGRHPAPTSSSASSRSPTARGRSSLPAAGPSGSTSFSPSR